MSDAEKIEPNINYHRDFTMTFFNKFLVQISHVKTFENNISWINQTAL